MITLSRLNGQVVAINPDLITWIEITPDTTVSLLGGDKIIVRESLDDVIQKVIAFRALIRAHHTTDAHPPSGEVLDAAEKYRERITPSRRPERPSFRPPTEPSRT